MFRYVVTGSTGFIGNHIATQFGKYVVPIPHEALKNPHTLAKLIPKTTRYIFHCAAYGNMSMQQDIDEMVRANIVNLNNLLLATEGIPYKAFINFSSSSVYGDKTHPMHETNSLDATDYYGVTKIAGELLVRAFVARTGKPVVNVRPFSVYGPGEAAFRFIPVIITSLKTGMPFTLAPGMHDWIHIADVVSAVKIIMEQAKDLKGRAINIGTGTETDNYDIVRLLALCAGKNMETIPFTPVAEMRSRTHWQADNTLLRSLGWVYTMSLREGLQECYDRTQ